MREQFEKLPEIAEILNSNGGGYYKENTNSYHHCNIYYDKYLNGAWYAYQEQQKRIDLALEYVQNAKDGYYGYTCEGGNTDVLASDIEKALKGLRGAQCQ